LATLTNFVELMPFPDDIGLGRAVLPKHEHSFVVLRNGFLSGLRENPRLGPPRNVFDRAWLNAPVDEDVQAAMTVLGRRRLDYEQGDSRRLNLRFVNLRGLDLKSAHLEGFDLEGANLQDADLSDACLCGAALKGVLLNQTRLERSDLRRADLSGAVFLNHRTRGADLREAIIEFAYAPEHDLPKKRAVGFEDADAHSAFIGGGIVPLTGAVVTSEDGPDLNSSRPFPPDKRASGCLPRSAPRWFEKR
jgi:hypothetical protein